MKFTVATTACLVGCAIASPVDILTRQAPFTDDTCQFATVVPPTPFGFLFPTASELGEIVGPVLKGLIGDAALEDIDTIADTLCVNSQEETSGGTGICAQVLQLVKDIANELVPETQAAQYKCLLNLICVANAGQPTMGTCNSLLRGGDCIANRILQTQDLECEGDASE